MEATYFSETSADLKRTTLRYAPEDNYRRENFSSYFTMLLVAKL
jgi:hypothetical protein